MAAFGLALPAQRIVTSARRALPVATSRQRQLEHLGPGIQPNIRWALSPSGSGSPKTQSTGRCSPQGVVPNAQGHALQASAGSASAGQLNYLKALGYFATVSLNRAITVNFGPFS
jgi:hypothetical protein